MKKMNQKICVALVTGLLAIGTVSTVYAAENSAGVAEYINKTADSAKSGQARHEAAAPGSPGENHAISLVEGCHP